MSAASAPSAWDQRGMAHEAVIFADDGGLVGRCVPFVEEGLASGQPVLAVVSPEVGEALGSALGSNAAHVTYLSDSSRWWAGGHGTMLAWDRDLRRLAAMGTPWRVVAEPVWLGRPEGQAWHRFEAASNRIFAELPFYAMCLHDRRRLSAQTLDTVRRTHPLVTDDAFPQASAPYQDPADFVTGHQPPWTPAPRGALTQRCLTARQARMWTGTRAEPFVDGDRLDAVMLSASELATSAMLTGTPAVLTTWADDEHFVVEVSIGGLVDIDPLAAYWPPSRSTESARVFWLVAALADDSSVHSSAAGCQMRLFFRRPGNTTPAPAAH
jgi:hypothetical protein